MIFNGMDLMTVSGREEFTEKHSDHFKVTVEKDGTVGLIGLGMPQPVISPDESMEEVAKKFSRSQNYNLPVLKDGKYIGFVSRANVFSAYREKLKEFSEY